MSICLCDISALEVIRSSGKLVGELLECPRTSSLEGCRAPNATELEDLIVGLGVRTRPVHVLTPRGVSTYPRQGVTIHRRSSLPRGSLIELRKGLRLSGPELALCQLAACEDIGLVDLVGIAFEMCGTYLIDDDPESWKGFVNTDGPATSPEKVARFSRLLGRTPGSEKLRKALSLTLPGAHSPMETVLAMLLSMPRKMGGFGIKGLVLNYPVSAGAFRAVIDVAIPKFKLGLEYKGIAYHAIEQSGRDDRRQNVLVGLGWTILNVWKEDLQDAVLFGRFQESLFRSMGCRFRPPCGFDAAQRNLRRTLVPGVR